MPAVKPSDVGLKASIEEEVSVEDEAPPPPHEDSGRSRCSPARGAEGRGGSHRAAAVAGRGRGGRRGTAPRGGPATQSAADTTTRSRSRTYPKRLKPMVAFVVAGVLGLAAVIGGVAMFSGDKKGATHRAPPPRPRPPPPRPPRPLLHPTADRARRPRPASLPAGTAPERRLRPPPARSPPAPEPPPAAVPTVAAAAPAVAVGPKPRPGRPAPAAPPSKPAKPAPPKKAPPKYNPKGI